jgi:nudix-type nucleoside diphosphatase (YffH/AdpP family)
MKFKVSIAAEEVIARLWSTVSKVTIDYTRSDGRVQRLIREVTDHGSAAAVLPIDSQRRTVLLVKQMRIAAYMAGYREAMIEACAGLLDGDDPAVCVTREAEEELGYRIHDPRFVCDAFASPGSLTERMALFTAAYSPADKLSDGGGVHSEGEDIHVIELGFDEAYAMIASGQIVDAKTIILLQHAKLMGT